MPFDNAAQAGILPAILFYDPELFNGELSEIESLLLEYNSIALSEITDEHQQKLSAESRPNQLKAWLCIVFTHLQDSAADLFAFSEQLGLDKSIVFESAVVLNRLDLLNISDIEEVDVDEVRKFFERAAKYGCVDSLDWMCQKISGESDASPADIVAYFLERNDAIYINAVQNSQTRVLDWFILHAPKFMATKIESIYVEALDTNNVILLSWLKNAVPDQFELLFKFDDIMLREDITDSVIDFCLTIPVFFEAMLPATIPAAQDDESPRHIQRFVSRRLTQLEQLKQSQADLSNSDEAAICVYILQYLLMHDDPASLDTLKLITQFPKVVELLNHETFEKVFKELLKLSIEKNRTIINYFLGSPQFVSGLILAWEDEIVLEYVHAYLSERIDVMKLREGTEELHVYLQLLVITLNVEIFQKVVRGHRTVNLSSCQLCEVDNTSFTEFMKALQNLENLQVLDLRDNPLGEMASDELRGLALSPLSKVKTLYLNYSDIEERMVSDPDFKGALKSLFPNLSPTTQANYFERVNDCVIPPTLKSLCFFTVKELGLQASSELPMSLRRA